MFGEELHFNHPLNMKTDDITAVDPNFQESTHMMFADIAQARGHTVPFEPIADLNPSTQRRLRLPSIILSTPS